MQITKSRTGDLGLEDLVLFITEGGYSSLLTIVVH